MLVILTLPFPDIGTNVTLPTVTKMKVESLDDIENIFKIGSENRKTASTKMNSQRYVCFNQSLCLSIIL